MNQSPAELYPCDICGELLPLAELFEFEDGRMVCEECLEELDLGEADSDESSLDEATQE